MNSSNNAEVREVVTCANAEITIGFSNVELKNKEMKRICLVEAFYEHFNSDERDSSALSGIEIESALALLMLRCLMEVGKEKERELQKEREEAAVAKASGKGKKASSKRKSARVSCSVSLVVPCGLAQQEAFLLYSAACRAAQFHGVLCSGGAGGSFAYSVRNLTNRAACGVAGALSLQPSVRSGLRGPAPEPPVLFLRRDGPRWEAALVRCEGGEEASRSGNLLGPGRLNTVSTASHRDLGAQGTFTEEGWAKILKAAGPVLGLDSSLGQDEALLVLVEPGGDSSASPVALQQELEAFLARAVWCEWLGGSGGSREAACAVGGCLLSAAELDSSKQYLLQRRGDRDRWAIAHQLPLADSLLQAGAVGLRIDYWGDDQPRPVQEVFRRHCRLWKADLGPLPASCDAGPALLLHFRWHTPWTRLGDLLGALRGLLWARPPSRNPAWLPDGDRLPQRLGWPKVRVLEKRDGAWRIIKTLTPLAARLKTGAGREGEGPEGEEGPQEPVDCCDLELSVDPATGLVKIVDSKGPRLSESRRLRQMWLALLLLVLLPSLLLLLWLAWGRLTDLYASRLQTQWLRDFYRTHAPDKLRADPDLVSRTVHKYKGRMFLLWRKLEKAYKVKLAAPYGAVEL